MASTTQRVSEEVTAAGDLTTGRPSLQSDRPSLQSERQHRQRDQSQSGVAGLSENRRRPRERQLSLVAGLSTASARKIVREEKVRGVIFPWSQGYKVWWSLTVIGAIVTYFTETYQISFAPAGMVAYEDWSSIIEYVLLSVFVVDIVVNFFLAYRAEDDSVVYDRELIVKHYLRRMFWIDVLGVFPFYAVALACAGQFDQDNTTTQYLALLGLFRMVRLHRVGLLFEILQYNSKVSLIWLTLVRNIAAALIWSHLSACVIYFIARQFDFDPDNTWIGDVEGMNSSQRYVTSLYWAIVTFVSVGYGDYYPVNAVEKIWGIIYMLLNIIITAWIIGSMTLLIVKQDEKTGLYRGTMHILKQFSSLNNFDHAMHKGLKTQLKLEFKNREVSDEQVLKQFPSAVRRKVLRRLYLPSLLRTSLMQNTRQQFVDAFLAGCSVEMFSPGEELLQRGSISSDLYLLLEGVVALVKTGDHAIEEHDEHTDGGTSVGDSDVMFGTGKGRRMEAGEFINEVAFLTESLLVDTVRTKTVCKTLTMSRTTYNLIAEDHPGSVGKVLHNLLVKIETAAGKSALQTSFSQSAEAISTAGDSMDTSDSYRADVHQTVESVQIETAASAVRDLIKVHMEKQKDDNTTRFLFAASRGDTSLIALMCDQGFEPNGCDYDFRTALMVASMKGNTDAVRLLLEFGANPDLVDMHGTSALYEATKNGHDDTIDVLLDHDAHLAMSEGLAASTLCQAVCDGDVSTLRRLLKAGIQVNAADYDKRTAVHIAAAEGNVEAMRVLVEYGADLSVEDRWSNTLDDEAQRSNSSELLDYLETLKGTAD